MALPKHSALKHGRAWAKAVVICYVKMAAHYKQTSSSSSASLFRIASHDFCTNFYTIHFKHVAIEETLEGQDCIDGMAYTWQQVAHLLQLAFLYCARIPLNPQELHYLKRGATA